ncbi:MAG: hypothetical protein ICV54_20895 [Nostoc sp. C3-bin3]|nr:hypothetical protein [Nostoc sp. C3-bin3]
MAVNRYESRTINYLCLQSVGVFRVRSLIPFHEKDDENNYLYEEASSTLIS